MTKVINVGCPAELFFSKYPIPAIRAKLEESARTYHDLQVLPDAPDKRVTLAVRVDDELADSIIKTAKGLNMSIVDYTARLLML